MGYSFEAKSVRKEPKEDSFRFLDYYPLVNQRIHKLGKSKKILNDKFKAHYTLFLRILATKYKPSIEEVIWFIYYLLLQDKIDQALSTYKKYQSEIEASGRI